MIDASTPAADRLDGAQAIARYLGITPRQVRYRAERGLLPHGREGERMVGSKRALDAYWRQLTSSQNIAA